MCIRKTKAGIEQSGFNAVFGFAHGGLSQANHGNTRQPAANVDFDGDFGRGDAYSSAAEYPGKAHTRDDFTVPSE